MAHVNVDDKSFEVSDGVRLVLALEDNGIDILHRCGGNAACTTCRVTFSEGEPESMTEAERELIEKRDLSGKRLSCQVLTAGTMTVEPELLVSTSEVDGPGDRPTDEIPA